MMHLGLAQGLVPTDPDELTPRLAHEIAALGVTRITTHFDAPLTDMAGARGRAIADLLADAGIRIVQCAGLSPNLVSPDAAVRAASLASLGELLGAARALRAQMIVSGCGSHNPRFSYGAARENHTPEARARLVESLRELSRRAEDAGIPAALECHVLTTLDTPEHVREIFDAVDSPWVCVDFDPVNFIGSLDAVYNSGAVAQHAAETLEPHLAPSAHLKDVVVEDDLVLKIAEAPAGAGLVDLDAVIESCRRLPDGSSLIVEHFGPEESAIALRCVADSARRQGIELG